MFDSVPRDASSICPTLPCCSRCSCMFSRSTSLSTQYRQTLRCYQQRCRRMPGSAVSIPACSKPSRLRLTSAVLSFTQHAQAVTLIAPSRSKFKPAHHHIQCTVSLTLQGCIAGDNACGQLGVSGAPAILHPQPIQVSHGLSPGSTKLVDMLLHCNNWQFL